MVSLNLTIAVYYR